MNEAPSIRVADCNETYVPPGFLRKLNLHLDLCLERNGHVHRDAWGNVQEGTAEERYAIRSASMKEASERKRAKAKAMRAKAKGTK